jgi:drug/metabolite transporter (DMT)-like permease
LKVNEGRLLHAKARKVALLEGIVAGTVFGTAAILIRFLQDSDAFYIAFWRLIFACLALGAILIVGRKPLGFQLLRKNLKELMVLGLFLGLHFIFFVSAVKDTTILNATVFVNTSPIFSVFVSSFVFKLKPSRFAVLGLVIAFAGVCTIAYAETATSQVNVAASLKGDLEALMAAFVESFYLSYGKNIRSRMNILHIMLPVYFFAAIFIGVLSIATPARVYALPTTTQSLLPLIGLGVLPTATAHTLYFSSLAGLKSFETATMALLEPIGATILGIVLFQEIPKPLFAFGAGLVLLGIVFIVARGE